MPTHTNPANNGRNWLTLEEMCQLTGIGLQTAKRKCAERRIHPTCGRKMAGRWKFRRSVIEKHGLILTDDEDASSIAEDLTENNY